MFSSKTRGRSHVRDHMQSGWPSHAWTNGKGIFFGIDSSPFVFSWLFDKPLKDCAIQESPTPKEDSPFRGGRELVGGSAQCLRRPCSFPASKALLAFGAGSRKSSLQRSFASTGKTRSHVGWSNCSHLSKALDWAYVPRHVVLFPCLSIARSCAQPAKACLAM